MKTDGKIFASADEALADVPDGVIMATHTWGFCGTPSNLFAAIMRSNIKDITLLCPNFFPHGALEKFLPGPASLLPKLKKLITPGIGGARAVGLADKGFCDDYVKSGQLETEVIPHGIWIERLHAAAMGLGGFYNPVGVGTDVEIGKEKRVIDGREYFLEKPIRPDVGLIKARKADRFGNLVYYGSSRGAHPIIAMASKLTIVEVDEVVEEGELDPEAIITPGVYVDRIVKLQEGDVGSDKHRRELMQFVMGDVILRRILLGITDKGDQK
ncbi:MAG: CoA transferase subunit A [Dehalococcoidia bacterium]|nr:CoA transferase subunit A [Dehalococcoidia bacterium]